MKEIVFEEHSFTAPAPPRPKPKTRELIKDFNQFTDDCNKFLTNGYELDEYNQGTYFWDNGYLESNKRGIFADIDGVEELTVCFRVTGATRGHIKVDNETMIITDVMFYSNCFDYRTGIGCYHKNILKLKDKYIGTVYGNW